MRLDETLLSPERTHSSNHGSAAGARNRIARLVSLILAAGLFAGLTGCGLEAPESPSFETTFYVPIEQETYTGQEMAQGLQAVEGDTTAPGPLTIRIDEALDPLMLDGEIRASIAAESFAAELEWIEFDAPDLPATEFPLSSMLPDSSSGLTGQHPLDPFGFELPVADLGTFDHFSQATFAAGELQLTLTNQLPVPVGGETPEQSLRIRLVDRSVCPSFTVVIWEVSEQIVPGTVGEYVADLAGVVLPNALGVEITGYSAGSAGQPVDLGGEGGLTVALSFGELVVEQLDGRLPELSVATETSLAMDETCAVTEAVVSSGTLSWTLTNHLPAALTLTLEAPQIDTGAGLLELEATLDPFATTQVDVDLSGAEMKIGSSGDWRWLLSAVSQQAGEEATVRLGDGVTGVLDAAELRFQSIQGVMDHVAVEVAPTETAIDFPDGVGGIDIVAAQAQIVVRNRANVSAEGSFELWAHSGGDTIRVPFALSVGAGSSARPAEARVTLNETNSQIAELLQLRPSQVALGGLVAIGDGTTAGSVQADDYIDGEFTLLAPMRMVLETAHQQGDPFEVALDEDLRDQVAEHLLQVTVAAEVENHFPTAVEITFHFARDEDALFATDDLVLHADPVAAATIDAATGRVTAATTSDVTLTVAAGDIGLFTEELLHGGLEITLLGDGEQPIEIWSTDYVKVKGVAAFRYRVE